MGFFSAKPVARDRKIEEVLGSIVARKIVLAECDASLRAFTKAFACEYGGMKSAVLPALVAGNFVAACHARGISFKVSDGDAVAAICEALPKAASAHKRPASVGRFT